VPEESELTAAGKRRKWLLVGLGNPGPEYESTPHNLGFLVIDRLAGRNGIRVTRKEAMALLGVGTIGGAEVLLAKPQTYMNLSGPSVQKLLARHELTEKDLVVVYDELDLPWTGLRIRPSGSAAGHNGVESVIRSLGSQEFVRVRLGIHPGHPVGDGAKFVLAPFKRAQKEELDELLDFASQAVESIIAEGVEKSMAKFNRRARG
jgi:PTH1 family peptidyl-tRNA hydrolase